MTRHPQEEAHAQALRDPESFWLSQATQVSWHQSPSAAIKKSPDSTVSEATPLKWSWFPDGQLSTCFNCVDRHVLSGKGESAAIIWDSPVAQSKSITTYRQLLDEVEALAGVLREQGVHKGDVVLVYMPMIPAAIFAILAISRLGAVHAIVFGGFSGPALAQRIDDAKPRLVLTASCSIEGRKPPLSYRPLVEKARALSKHFPKLTLVWQREQRPWGPLCAESGELSWRDLVNDAKRRNLKVNPVPVGSDDPLYILYTSGTTGSPKGVVRNSGGHAVGMNFCMRYVFGLQGSNDVVFAASDIGWVFGHSFIVYGPLLAGATTVLFEGKPVGTPDASTFWRIVGEYGVSTLCTAPSALRAIRAEDPKHRHFRRFGKEGKLKSLKAIFLAGERSEPGIVQLYESLLNEHCAKPAQVIDNWWSTEIGSPITGLGLGFHPQLDLYGSQLANPPRTKPGSAGKPIPGHNLRVINDAGSEVSRGTSGNLVLDLPLGPTALTTLWNNDERFYTSYLRRFGGKFYDTGDLGYIDEEGYVHILSRSDDVINVAAHRLSSASIEEVILSHPSIAECCVVGMPDPQKGHKPCAFLTLSRSPHPTAASPTKELQRELQQAVREQISPIAGLGAIIQGWNIIPKTRSGKVMRRVLRDLVEGTTQHGAVKDFAVPVTVEDPTTVDNAKEKLTEYLVMTGVGASTQAKL